MAHIKPMLSFQTMEDAFISPLGSLKVDVKLISHGSRFDDQLCDLKFGHILGER